MSYWYIDARDDSGVRFCWAKEPTYSCPMAEPTVYVPGDGEDGAGGHHALREHLVGMVGRAAQELGMDSLLLGLLIRQRHRSGGVRLRRNGKLTDLCSACGHKLVRHGFRTWVEEPVPEGEETAGDRISQRLFGGAYRQRDHKYWNTKKEAEAWARREAAKTAEGATA